MLGEKLFVSVCRSRSRKQLLSKTVPLFPCHLLIISGVLLVDTQPRYLHRGKLAATLHLTFHLGEPTKGEAIIISRVSIYRTVRVDQPWRDRTFDLSSRDFCIFFPG